MVIICLYNLRTKKNQGIFFMGYWLIDFFYMERILDKSFCFFVEKFCSIFFIAIVSYFYSFIVNGIRVYRCVYSKINTYRGCILFLNL